MKCAECGEAMVSSRKTYKYKECGLPNVQLVGIEVRTCPNCGEEDLVIPNIRDLHALIARLISRQLTRLTAAEVRFLRKHLGWSGVDFARHIGVTPETVSRWENDKEKIGPVPERLLRVLVANLKPAEQYPVDVLANLQAAEAAHRFALREVEGNWSEATPSLPPVSEPPSCG